MQARRGFPALVLATIAAALFQSSIAHAGDSASLGAALAESPAQRAAAVSGVAPVLVQPDSMIVSVGATADQQLTATDADGDPLTFTKLTGPTYMTVTTTSPGTGLAYGNVHLAPGPSDAGTTVVTVRASDGSLSDQKSFPITVRSVTAPYLNQPYDMSLKAGQSAYQGITATDSDGDFLTFSIVAGPTYMSVSTDYRTYGYATGTIYLSPPPSTPVGGTTATVRVTDGALTDQKSFNITILPADQPPVMGQPANMSATVGELAEQTVTATDPDGDYVYVYQTAGPGYMSVSSPGGYGTTTATIRLAPAAGDEGPASGSLTAYSNGLSDTKSFSIIISAGNFPPACGPSTFSHVTTVFDYGLIEVQTADLNLDGILDILVEMPASGRAATALGNGDGSFGTAMNLDAGTQPVTGVIGDFNRDDVPDVAVVDFTSGNVYVYLGDGNGGFGPRRGFVMGGARSIVTADVNRDGKLDLLATLPNTNTAVILRGNGDGTFQSPTAIQAGYGAWHLATPDLNGDGAPDLIVVNPGDNDISVYRNNGSGGFGSRVDYPVGTQPLAVSAADLNGNGTVDVVVSNSYSATVTVFSGNGDGTLGMKRTFSTGPGPREMAIRDLNGDGYLDLATANFDGYTVSILPGDGTGAFGGHADHQVPSGPYGMASGDFNDDLRTDLIVSGYYGGSVTVLLNDCAPPVDHPPVVTAPRTVSGSEGILITFTITANDPDGPAITDLTANLTSLPLGHNATFTPDPSLTSGTFSWTPSFQAARLQPYPVVFTATNVTSGSATTSIRVSNTNRPPVANAGGPYSAYAGYPLTLDGSGSVDPDGDALTYHWVFGDGKTGMGVNPSHTYAALGIYAVALTVSDGSASDIATATVNVVGIFDARAFTSGGSHSIRLSSGKPQWCVNLEPIGRAYDNLMVNLSSIVMMSEGTGSVPEIHATLGKTTTVGDKDANGVDEISACFAKDDLRLLFSNLRGTTTVTVTFQGSLFNGGIFRARMDISVQAGGGSLSASLAPNPLNPEGILTFVTKDPGRVRVDVFDLNGRLVQRLMDEPNLPAGYHDVRISSRRENGESMASGVYFYRVESEEGQESGRFTVLK